MPEPGRRVLGHLLFDPRILFSWILFTVIAVLTGWIVIQTDVPPRPVPVPQTVAPAPAAKVTPPAAAPSSTKRRHRRSKSSARQSEQSAATQSQQHAPPQPAVQTSAPAAAPQEWKPKSAATIVLTAIRYGYAAWALYWGIPACLWLLFTTIRKMFTFGSTTMVSWLYYFIGFWPILIGGTLFIVGGVFYSVFGGGVLHFVRYWLRLLNPTLANAPAAAVPPPSPQPGGFPTISPAQSMIPIKAVDAQDRLRKLNELHQNGLITSEEFARRKSQVLDEI